MSPSHFGLALIARNQNMFSPVLSTVLYSATGRPVHNMVHATTRYRTRSGKPNSHQHARLGDNHSQVCPKLRLSPGREKSHSWQGANMKSRRLHIKSASVELDLRD